MALCRRTLWMLMIFFPFNGYAFDVVYGSFFIVPKVSIQADRPILPLTGGKYANVRILNKETFHWLRACTEATCSQPGTKGNTEIQTMRAANTRPNMWIAQVAVDQRWLLTFLIFREESAVYRVVEPETVRFTDGKWLENIKKQLMVRAINW